MTPQIVTAVTPELLADLAAQGYRLPEQWPTGALLALDVTKKGGWTVDQPAEGGTIYTAPDGTKFARAAYNTVPQLVGLTAGKYAARPVPLNVLPGSERPAWLPVVVRSRSTTNSNGGRMSSSNGTPRTLSLTDGNLRKAVASHLDAVPDIGASALIKLLRSEGLRMAGGRVRATLREMRAARPAPEPKAKAAKVVTKPAPKPSAKKVARKKATAGAASKQKRGRK